MSKRRTRKDKVEAKHYMSVSWSPNKENELNVNRQSKNEAERKTTVSNKNKNAEQSAKESQIKATKKDLLKSIVIALAIITLELVLYLAWNK